MTFNKYINFINSYISQLISSESPYWIDLTLFPYFLENVLETKKVQDSQNPNFLAPWELV